MEVLDNSRINRVSGRILHKETGLGLSNLTLLIYDQAQDLTAFPSLPNSPVPPYLAALLKVSNSLGSAITDDKGNFSFHYDMNDALALTQGKRRLKLFIVVLAPEDENTEYFANLLYFSRTPRANAGKNEIFNVTISSATLQKKNVPIPKAETVEEKVQKFIAQKEEEEKYEKLISQYKWQKQATQKEQNATAVKQFLNKVSPPPAGSANHFFVKDDESVETVEQEAIKAGVEIANKVLKIETGANASRKKGVKVSLLLSDTQKAAIEATDPNNGSKVFRVPESQLKEILQTEDASPPVDLIRQNPVEKYCIEKSAEAKCAIENLTGTASQSENGQVESNGNGLTLTPVKEEDILTNVQKMLVDMSSPESLLAPHKNDLPKRPDAADVQESVGTFSMKKGPAESPSYFDFHALEIAFPHVWMQVFDRSFIGTLEQTPPDTWNDLRDPGTNTYADTTNTNVNQSTVPISVVSAFDITAREYLCLPQAYQDELETLADQIIKKHIEFNHFGLNGKIKIDKSVIRELREQGERIIEFCRNDNYSSLHSVLEDLGKKLNEKYVFQVFAAEPGKQTVNFGLMKTYRQKWNPVAYQVGDLVKTIPLAPKEEIKYSVKTVRNEKIAKKESRKNNSTLQSEMSSTTRAEAEIVKKANAKTNFSYANEGGFSLGLGGSSNTTNFGTEAGSDSQDTKKDFREAVVKASQEFKEERSLEIDTETTYTSEYNQSGTIVNPNDELAVTYLFYELQRRFRVTEQIYRVMPVVLVAQEVPNPADITEAWLISHDWILNRFLLDDSFRPALQYLSSRNVGDDFAVRELRKNLRQQRRLVETLELELTMREGEVNNRYKALENAINNRIEEESAERTDGWWSDFNQAFGGDGQDPEAAKARELAAKDAHQHAVEKSEKIAMALRQEVNNLHTITEAYNKKLEDHLNIETMVSRLKTHVKNNILYYMQAIWSMEPPDQRYFRLYDAEVPMVEASQKRYTIELEEEEDIFAEFRPNNMRKYSAWIQASMKSNVPKKKLVEVADLDNLLGFKGNYMIFPLKEHNALTEIMAAPFVDEAFGAYDPDELGNVSLDDYAKYVCCLHKELPADEFNRLRPTLQKWLEKLLADPLRNGDEIIVPSGSLYIEMLPSSHTLLEDFKLKHRAMDVLKVQAEVRQMELENLRYAARLLAEERDDPRVEKKIVVEGSSVGVSIEN